MMMSTLYRRNMRNRAPLAKLQLSQARKHHASQHDTLTMQQPYPHPIQPHITQYQHQSLLLSSLTHLTHKHLSSEILGIILQSICYVIRMETNWLYTF